MTASNAAKRPNKIRPEKCPLDLVTGWSLGTLARGSTWRGEWRRPGGDGDVEGREKEGTVGIQIAEEVCPCRH